MSSRTAICAGYDYTKRYLLTLNVCVGVRRQKGLKRVSEAGSCLQVKGSMRHMSAPRDGSNDTCLY